VSCDRPPGVEMVEMVGQFSKTPRVLRAVRVEIFIYISTILTISTLNGYFKHELKFPLISLNFFLKHYE
jgi:hypothetical protein